MLFQFVVCMFLSNAVAFKKELVQKELVQEKAHLESNASLIQNTDLYCVKIITSDCSVCDGNLGVKVYTNGVTTAEGDFTAKFSNLYTRKEQFEICFNKAVTKVAVYGPTNNAWGGDIVYTDNGGVSYLPMVCKDCINGKPSKNGKNVTTIVSLQNEGGSVAKQICPNGGWCNFFPGGCTGGSVLAGTALAGKVIACKGSFTGHPKDAGFCGTGWHTCNGKDVHVTYKVTKAQSTSFKGCYVYDSMNDCNGCWEHCGVVATPVKKGSCVASAAGNGYDLAAMGLDCMVYSFSACLVDVRSNVALNYNRNGCSVNKVPSNGGVMCCKN